MGKVTLEVKPVRRMDEIPLCPYCDQPMFCDAVIIRDERYGCYALAHRDCVEENEE